jgi:putative heme iron utilization protein
MYEMDKKVVEEIRKEEQIKEASSLELSGPISNSYINIHSKEEFKKLIQAMKEPNLDKYINLTEKYFTGKNSLDIFLVVHLKTTRSELEVTIIDYRLALSVIKK